MTLTEQKFDGQGKLADEETRKIIVSHLAELAHYTRALTQRPQRSGACVRRDASPPAEGVKRVLPSLRRGGHVDQRKITAFAKQRSGVQIPPCPLGLECLPSASTGEGSTRPTKGT